MSNHHPAKRTTAAKLASVHGRMSGVSEDEIQAAIDADDAAEADHEASELLSQPTARPEVTLRRGSASTQTA